MLSPIRKERTLWDNIRPFTPQELTRSVAIIMGCASFILYSPHIGGKFLNLNSCTNQKVVLNPSSRYSRGEEMEQLVCNMADTVINNRGCV